MKLGHFPVALGHSPRFVMRHGLAMLRETFRGSSVRSWLGLEDDRVVFDRYRKLRRAERASIWQDLGDTATRTPERRQATAAGRAADRLSARPVLEYLQQVEHGMGPFLLRQTEDETPTQEYGIVPGDLREPAGDLVTLEGIVAIRDTSRGAQLPHLLQRNLARDHPYQLTQLGRVDS